MNKKKEIGCTFKIVKQILIDEPNTRNSDELLYLKVCEKFSPGCISKPFWYILANLNNFGCPKFETVRRSRQRAQELFPNLRGVADVEAQRMLNEEAFVEFARSAM